MMLNICRCLEKKVQFFDSTFVISLQQEQQECGTLSLKVIVCKTVQM
jgi:hypothetical protein